MTPPEWSLLLVSAVALDVSRRLARALHLKDDRVQRMRAVRSALLIAVGGLLGWALYLWGIYASGYANDVVEPFEIVLALAILVFAFISLIRDTLSWRHSDR
jgi:hypothetical protein